MEVRRLEATDAAVYWPLRLRALQEHPTAFSTSYEEALRRQDPISSLAASIAHDEVYIFGAFSGEELVGAVTLVQETYQKLRHRANIVAMYIAPIKRGTGVGKAVLEAALTHAKTLDILKVNLTVVADNASAKRLYERLGFVTYGTEKKALFYDGHYYDEEHMVLFLGEEYHD